MIFPNSFEIFFFPPNAFVSVSCRVVCELLIASQSAGKLRVSVIAKAMCLPGPQIQVSVGL